MLMTNQQPAKLSQPGVSPLHNPATLVTPQFPSVLVAPMLVVVPVRHDQFDAAFPEPLTERVRIVSAIAITRSGFCRGRPFARGTRTWASVDSASVTSLGEALSSRTPSGTP